MRNKFVKALSIILSAAVLMSSATVPAGATELRNDAQTEAISTVEETENESVDKTVVEESVDEIIEEADGETDRAVDSKVEETELGEKSEEAAIEDAESGEENSEKAESEEEKDKEESSETVESDEEDSEAVSTEEEDSEKAKLEEDSSEEEKTETELTEEIELAEGEEEEVNAGSYNIYYLVEGESIIPEEGQVQYHQSGKPDNNGKVGGNDLYIDFQLDEAKKVANVQYRIGEDGTYKDAQIKELEDNYFWYIPKAEITGDIYVNVVQRDYYENIAVGFNDGENSHYSVETVNIQYGSTGESSIYSGPSGTFNAKESDSYIIKIVPEEGYRVASVSASAGSIEQHYDYDYDYGEMGTLVENTYDFHLNNLSTRPDNIVISFVLINEGQKISSVIYDTDAANIVIAEKNNEENVITATSVSNKNESGRSTADYILTAGVEYKVTISCKPGYSFNEYGICANELKDDGNYSKRGTHVNKNTTAAYSFTFKAGRREIWVNTKAIAHLIFNINKTDYNGTGITVEVAKYADNGKKQIFTPSKKSKDGSCEYVITVDDAHPYAVQIVGAKGSSVLDAYISSEGWENSKKIDAESGIVRFDSDSSDIDINKSGEYTFSVTEVDSKCIPSLTLSDGTVINPTAANGNTFVVPRKTDLRLFIKNSKGRVSKLISGSFKYPGSSDEVKVLNIAEEDDAKYYIIPQISHDYAGKKIALTLVSDIAPVNGNIVYLVVEPAITKVSFGAVKSVGPKNGKYQALVQEIGATKEYAYTLLSAEKSSVDTLAAYIYTDEDAANTNEENEFSEATSNNDYAEVSIAAGKLKVITKTVQDSEKRSYISIVNTSTGKKVAGFYLDTTIPSYMKSAPGASLATASDVMLDIYMSLPKGVAASECLYYKVQLEPNKYTKYDNEAKAVNESVMYIATANTAPVASVNAFLGENNEVITDLGAGCGTKLNAKVSLVLTKGTSPAEEGSVILKESAVKTLAVSTKEPYYSDKITLKKGTTNLYAGQSGIKIADINLGAKTSYNTTEYWSVKSVVDASGNEVESTSITLKTGTDAGKSTRDTGIYATVDENTPAGKYKVTVQTKAGFYVPEASIDITVLPTIDVLDVAPVEVYKNKNKDDTYYILKQNNKAASAKTTLVAKDQDDNVIKAPKVTYEIGKYVSETDTVTPAQGLTVNNKGVISVAKNFAPVAETTYELRVKAVDYQGNDCTDIISIEFQSGNYGIKVFDVYIQSGDFSFTKVTGQKVPINEELYYYAEDINGNNIIGVKNGNGEPCPSRYFSYTSLRTGYRLECSASNITSLQDISGPLTFKYTIYGLDGSKATASVTRDYFSNSEEYTNIVVTDGKFSDSQGFVSVGQYVKSGSEIIVDENKSENSTGKIAAPDDVIYVSLCKGTDKIVSSGDLAMNSFAEGSLSVTGAKVVESDARKQNIGIVLTKPEAKVTLTKKITNATTKKQETKKFTWTIKNSALSKAKAPATSKIGVCDNYFGAALYQPVYAEYTYDKRNYLEVTLKEPLKNSDGDVICLEDCNSVQVELSNCEGLPFSTEAATPSYYCYEKSNKYYVTVSIFFEEGSQVPSKKFSFNINYRYKETDEDEDGKYLTSTPTTVTVTPAKFKKSFAVNSTQNMSLKDGYSINIGTKSTGVKEVTYTRLLNYNKGGKYNNFTDFYKIDDNNRLTVKDAAAREALFADSNVDKKGNPLPMDGYVESEVTYENGDVEYYTSKITVKWADQVDKYSFVVRDQSTSESFAYARLWNSSSYVDNISAVKLAGLPNDSPVITSIEVTSLIFNQPGWVRCGLETDKKAGTYKTTALVMLKNSGCPHTGTEGDEITTEDWATYGIQVPIAVKWK